MIQSVSMYREGGVSEARTCKRPVTSWRQASGLHVALLGMSHVTDIIEKSQSNIDKNPSENRKQKKELPVGNVHPHVPRPQFGQLVAGLPLRPHTNPHLCQGGVASFGTFGTRDYSNVVREVGRVVLVVLLVVKHTRKRWKNMARINSTPHVVQACLCIIRSILQVTQRVPPTCRITLINTHCAYPPSLVVRRGELSNFIFLIQGAERHRGIWVYETVSSTYNWGGSFTMLGLP